MTDYYMAFSFHDLRNLGDLIIVDPYPSDLAAYKKHIQEIIKHILIKMEYADLAKGILFYKMDDDETMYLTQLKSFTNELYSLLEDLDWFAKSVCFYAGTPESNIGIYKRETEKYKSEINVHKATCRKIWEIIESFGCNIYDNKKKIIAMRMSEAMKSLDPSVIQESIAKLIDYESEKINKILY